MASEKKEYTYNPYKYDPYQKSQGVIDAVNKANTAAEAVTNRGSYGYINQEALDGLVNKLETRPAFSYDFNTDALYQQYKDKYIQQGKMAMADTIGMASAMTGGYGNSYAQTAGQQQYQAHLGQLNDVIPELYQLAYNRDRQEVQDIKDAITYHQGERNYGLGVWNDETNRLIADRTYLQGIADTLSADEYNKWYDGVTLGQTNHTNNENAAYNAWRDSIEDDRAERELAMKEEAWKLEKEAYNTALSTPAQTTPKKEDEPKEPAIKATETKKTNSFIALHQTKDEYMRRGKSYKQYLDYIEAEIKKDEDSFTDEELAYLKQYYGF